MKSTEWPRQTEPLVTLQGKKDPNSNGILATNRYNRQEILKEIGTAGQCLLSKSSVLIVGVGALGSMTASLLARAGVGKIRIIDRDLVEETNLQRQLLYTESDVGSTKASAAKKKLEAINSSIKIEAIAENFSPNNARQLAKGCDLLIDGLDNLEGRYLLNDLSIESGRPYLYGGAVATYGLQATFLPHPQHKKESNEKKLLKWEEVDSTPCFRCLFPITKNSGPLPTCETSGILASITTIISSRQSTDALKLLTNQYKKLSNSLYSFDVWRNQTQSCLYHERSTSCIACVKGKLNYLHNKEHSLATSLCGQNAVQILPRKKSNFSCFKTLESKLAQHGNITKKEDMIKLSLKNNYKENGPPIILTVFKNRRAVIYGTNQAEYAKSIYAKYIGE